MGDQLTAILRMVVLGVWGAFILSAIIIGPVMWYHYTYIRQLRKVARSFGEKY